MAAAAIVSALSVKVLNFHLFVIYRVLKVPLLLIEGPTRSRKKAAQIINLGSRDNVSKVSYGTAILNP